MFDHRCLGKNIILQSSDTNSVVTKQRLTYTKTSPMQTFSKTFFPRAANKQQNGFFGGKQCLRNF